jgi:hypothetical protein
MSVIHELLPVVCDCVCRCRCAFCVVSRYVFAFVLIVYFIDIAHFRTGNTRQSTKMTRV